jgi:peroxiredoxin
VAVEESLSGKLAGIVLPDSEGKEIRLGSLWSESPAVLVFLRHYGWIFCREHVAQLREHEQAFREKGARLAAVGLGDRHYARLFREETGISFPLLIDENREAYRAAGLRSASLLHLLRGDNATARKRAKIAGHRQPGIPWIVHSLGKNPFQLGGSFVFGPGNIDRYAPLSETFGDNASPAALLAALPAS